MRAAVFAVALALAACGGKSTPKDPPADPDPEPQAACVTGGCSGQLCVEEGEGGISTCEWQDAYACYKTATCERQADGACGWTETEELTACLADPPATDQPTDL